MTQRNIMDTYVDLDLYGPKSPFKDMNRGTTYAHCGKDLYWWSCIPNES